MSRTPNDADDGTYDYSCDLPSCDVTTPYQPVEEDEFPDEPPPGWFSLSVLRHGSQGLSVAYCSHAHMVEGLDEHLPEPKEHPLPEQEGWLSTLGCGLALLSVVAVLVLGVVTAVVLLGDLVAWLAAVL